jgi:glycosyltransferase involved in cell wall biosynthesis
MADSKRILFVSALDFKKKSIQVIRKTPEAFVNDGWQVDYLLARDGAKKGNYFYEDEINPEGVNIIRLKWKLTWLRNMMPGVLHTISTKFAAYKTTWMLYSKAKQLVKENTYDVVYGYEIHGVLAVSRLRKKNLISESKIVSRFQGTWLALYFLNNNTKKLRLNKEAIIALNQESNLCIMTNDGTQGNLAMDKLGDTSKHDKFVFWTNGVDSQEVAANQLEELTQQFKADGEFIFLSVSRLESWKRVERGINAFITFKQANPNLNARLIIVGEGSSRQELEKIAKQSDYSEYINFTGGVAHDEVKNFLNLADAFISMYDLSNVGNPLLEAIRANKIIFTLNNGDTASWIKHRENGFIYEVDQSLSENAAKDFAEITSNDALRASIVNNIRNTEKEKLWTWSERMSAEIKEVNQLLN